MSKKNSSLAIVLYRCILKECKSINNQMRLQLPINPLRWGSGSFLSLQSLHHTTILKKLLPTISETQKIFQTAPQEFSSNQLKTLTRNIFKSRKVAINDEQEKLWIDDAFAALRVIGQQKNLSQCSSRAVTNGIQVDASAVYLPDRSDPDGLEFVFCYRLQITNFSDQTVKLMGRHWLIQDGNGDIQEVPRNSPGVVGKTPTIEPNQVYEYFSGTQLSTPKGVMKGSFQMLIEEKEIFDVQIGAFSLDSSVANETL